MSNENTNPTREADKYKSALEKERQQRIDDDRANVARFQPVLDAAKGAGWKPGEETIGEFVSGLVARIAALEAVPLPADLDELDTRLIGVAVWSAHLLPVPTAAGLDVTPEAVESVREEMDQARAALRALAADRGRMREAMKQINDWRQAYPLDVFPEPDLKRVAELLKSRGMTLDSVSAYVSRHVLKGVGEIVDAALADRGGK